MQLNSPQAVEGPPAAGHGDTVPVPRATARTAQPPAGPTEPVERAAGDPVDGTPVWPAPGEGAAAGRPGPTTANSPDGTAGNGPDGTAGNGPDGTTRQGPDEQRPDEDEADEDEQADDGVAETTFVGLEDGEDDEILANLDEVELGAGPEPDGAMPAGPAGAGGATDGSALGAAEDALSVIEQIIAEEAIRAAQAPAAQRDGDGAPGGGPGAVPVPQRGPGDVRRPRIAVWEPAVVREYRERLFRAQALFVDDPYQALDEARTVVVEAVHALASALLSAQERFDPRRLPDTADTESMRVAIRRYRDFLDRVLSL